MRIIAAGIIFSTSSELFVFFIGPEVLDAQRMVLMTENHIFTYVLNLVYSLPNNEHALYKSGGVARS